VLDIKNGNKSILPFLLIIIILSLNVYIQLPKLPY